MNILLLGDIVGPSGRKAIIEKLPEIIKKTKVDGTLINHSEHRISSKEITNLVKRLKKLKMKNLIQVSNNSFKKQKVSGKIK